MKHWSLRRAGQWHTFDSDPRIAYYKFLRAVYGHTASEALDRVNEVMPARPWRNDHQDDEDGPPDALMEDNWIDGRIAEAVAAGEWTVSPTNLRSL